MGSISTLRMSVARCGRQSSHFLNRFARVPVSGLIAQYDEPATTNRIDHPPSIMRQVLVQRLLIQGLLNYDFTDEYYDSFILDVSKWISEGRVKYREDIVDGLAKRSERFHRYVGGKKLWQTPGPSK